MSSVDDRIVNMQFNNKQFTAGVTDTQKSLQGLEQALAKTGQGGGLSALSNGVQQTTSRFGAMRIAGITAVATIASKATSAGLNLVKSMALDPVLDGFREYELNLKSVQTIMANTGEKINVVNKYLKNLNDYSDQTIYNFGQMAQNIGRFTAAGVELPAATDAIKGMANAAALTGADANQLNSAMYQMSQALSAGTIKLMDWNSLVNANMGTENIQEALKATARTMEDGGKAMETSIAQAGNFRDSLQSGWLEADIFTKTMKVMAGETNKAGDAVAFSVEELKKMGYSTEAAKELNRLSQASIDSATKIKTFTQMIDVVKESIGSGWASIFQGLFGNLNQASNLWTGVGNTITDALDSIFGSIEGVLTGWRKAGGYQAMWAGFGNIFKAIGNVLSPFVKAFQELVPSTGSAGKGLASLSKGFESVTGWLEVVTRGADALTPVLVAIAKGIGFLFQGLGALAPIASMAASALGDLVGQGAEIAQGLLDGLLSGLNPQHILNAITSLAKSIVQWIKNALGIHSPSTEMIPVGEGIILGIVEGIVQYAGLLVEAVGRLGDGLKPLGAKIVLGLIEGIKSASVAALGAIQSLGGSLAGALQGALSGAQGAASGAGGALSSVGAGLSSGFEVAGRVISVAVGIIGKAFDVLGSAVGWIKDQLSDLFDGFGAMEWAAFMNALFTGSLILSIKKLSDGFTGFGQTFIGVFDQLTNTLKTMQNAVKAKIIRDIAIAVGVLTAAIVVLTFIDPKKIAISLGAIATMMGLLTGTLLALSKVSAETNMAVLAASIVMISGAMINLSVAIAILGNLDMATLAKGIGAMALALGIMVLAVLQFQGLEGAVLSAGTSIAIMSAAMIALSGAVLAFGMMDLSTLAKGLGAMAIGLGLIVNALLALSVNGKGVLAGAAAIAIVSGALNALALAVFAFGNMDLNTLAVGFGAVAVALGMFVFTLNALSANMAGVIGAGTAMVLMATALNVLVGVVILLGSAPWDVVVRGLTFVAIALGIFVAAGFAAMAVIPGLMALSKFVLALGAAMILAGTGMTLFAAGLAVLVGLGTAAIALIVAAIQVFLTMLPSIAVQVASAFVAFIQVIANASPKIRTALGTILRNMLGTVRDAIPEFRKLVQALINAGIQVIRDSVPRMIDAAFHIVDSFLDKVHSHLPDFIRKGTDIIIAFIKGVGEAAVRITNAAGQTILDFLRGIRDAIDRYAGPIRDAGLDIAVALIDGLTGGLLSRGVDAVRSAAATIANALPGWMKKVLGISSPSKVTYKIGQWAAEGFTRGILSGIKEAVSAAIQMANAIIAAGDEKVAEAQRKARAAQREADRRDAKADITAKRAAAARRRAEQFAKQNPNQKARAKELDKRAKELERLASNQRGKADQAQKTADKAHGRVEAVRTFQEADLVGKGDIRQAQAVALADRAAKMLAKANAEAAEAKRLMETNKKAGREMLKQAREDAKKAKQLAEEAARKNKQAQSYYEQEVEQRLQALKDDAEFEAADTAGRIRILQQRAEANEAKAKAAQEASQALIAQAEALAGTDAAAALRLVEEAEAKAEEAKAAAEAAKQEREQMAQLMGGDSSSGGNGTMPSSSVLEDAAKVIDRYTESLQQAESLAAAQQHVYQFNQNNYSPEALSSLEIYRQSKNLLSVAEIKMGVNPSNSE